jgi:predicted small secreted protein
MLDHQDCAPPESPYVVWLLGLVAVGLLALSLNACNTVSGMGKDVKAAGSAVSNAAQNTEDKM